MRSNNGIVIIEHITPDNEGINKAVSESIRRGILDIGEPKTVGLDELEDFYNSYIGETPSIVIINNACNSFRSLDIVKQIVRRKKDARDIFTIIVALGEDEGQQEYFQYDCIDVIKYPFNEDTFIARLRAHCIRAYKYGSLLSITRLDAMTKLYNKEYMAECIGTEISRAQRTNRPFSIAMIDIDFFKTVNDTHGHVTGDQVLKGIASIIKNSSRVTDYVCRYGGEEFLVILSDTAADQGRKFGEKIRSIIEQAEFRSIEGKIVHCTVTIGVAKFDINKSVQENIGEADALLYVGKAKGRNIVIGGETHV